MGFVSAVITPALIAAIVSLLINVRAEKAKAHREVISKTFEAARTCVAEAVVAAGEYFSVSPAKRTAASLAKVKASEKECRVILANLMEWGPRLDPPISVGNLDKLSTRFIGSLTSSSFGAKAGRADTAHAEAMAEVGALLRIEILLLQQNQMFDWLSSDFIERIRRYFTKKTGVDRELRAHYQG